MNKFIIVLFFILFHFLDSFAQIQQVWMQRYNSYNSTDDNASDMFIDSSGNVYITGWSAGVTTLKYNRDGQLVWHNLIDDLYLRPLKIALSKSGKIYVSCIIDGGWWVLIKYDSSGNFIWSKEFRNGIGSVNDPTAYLLDDDEYSYIAGTIWNSGYKKVGFVKYDSSGSLIWTKYYEYAYEGYLNSGASIVMDGYKNIYIGGYLNVRPVTICNSLLIKYNPAGEQLWSKIYDTSVYISNQLVKLICDKQNNVIAGLFVTDSSTQQFRVATIKYSSQGGLIWNKHFVGPANLDFIKDINSDIYSNIYVLIKSGSRTYGGYEYSNLKYDSSGNYVWERRYTGNDILNEDSPFCLYIDTLCNSYITGSTVSIKYNSIGNLLWIVNNKTWTNEYSNLGNVIKLDRFNNILILGSGYSSLSNSDDILTAKYSQSVGIINQNQIANKFKLFQNYPNPFNPTTKIKFDIPALGSPLGRGAGGMTVLKVYDILGKEIETLVNEKLNPGTYEVTFNASQYPSGVYFYTLISGEYRETKKMLMIK